MTRKLTIQIHGLPGSGKTTIANIIIKALHAKGYICGDSREGIGMHYFNVVYNPISFEDGTPVEIYENIGAKE